jgi:transcriptional regulator with PAS, ATPase and Fis domain
MKPMISRSDVEFYLEQVYGAIVIDMDGRVIYMNNQCAEYLGVDLEESIGRHVIDVFPDTKMVEGLKLEKPEVVFYHIHGRIGASVHIPLRIKGQKVGLLEYDLFQSYDPMDEFVDNYKVFQTEVVNYYKEEIKHLRNTKYTIDNLIGSSETIRKLKKKIEYAARTNSTVLISGETGTGKELAAHAIHHLSLRKLREFIKINASALPESLAESELFGYDEGSFTGALKTGKKGKFELAHKGTLFIDEVHQMPKSLQPKILRALQEKEIERIGGQKSIPVDVRIIAATNTNLGELVKQHQFRDDLYYRLNVVEIHMPALREHMEDLPELVQAIIIQLNNLLGTRVDKVDSHVYGLLASYHWPGNVRELQNTLERAMNYVEGQELKPEHFDFGTFREPLMQNSRQEGENPIDVVRNQAERELILQTLKDCRGNKSKAARMLCIARPLLYQKIKRLQIHQAES